MKLKLREMNLVVTPSKYTPGVYRLALEIAPGYWATLAHLRQHEPELATEVQYFLNSMQDVLEGTRK